MDIIRLMPDGARQAVAQIAETMAAEALLERGAPTVKARGGVTRMLRIVGPDGKPTGRLATHGEVLAGAAKAAEIEIQTQDGKRPERIVCVDCAIDSPTRFVFVPAVGGIPKRCIVHASEREQMLYRQRLAKFKCAADGCSRLVRTDGGLCARHAASKHMRQLPSEILAERARMLHKKPRAPRKLTDAQRATIAAAVKAAKAKIPTDARSAAARMGHETRRRTRANASLETKPQQ